MGSRIHAITWKQSDTSSLFFSNQLSQMIPHVVTADLFNGELSWPIGGGAPSNPLAEVLARSETRFLHASRAPLSQILIKLQSFENPVFFTEVLVEHEA